MLSEISDDKFGNMNAQELRWLDNIKKAFNYSDSALLSEHPEDRCLPELFNAVDTAKKLRRSLIGQSTSNSDNKKRYIKFVGLEIPAARPGGSEFELTHARTGKTVIYHLGEIIYDIRCMLHEGENLNVDEDIDYHILLDWNRPQFYANVCDGRLVLDGFFLCERLRQILAKLITGLEAMNGFANGALSFSMTIEPDLNAIQPDRKRRT